MYPGSHDTGSDPETFYEAEYFCPRCGHLSPESLPEDGWLACYNCNHEWSVAPQPKAPCPICRATSPIKETFTQATRTEPPRSLGWQGYCSACDCYFRTAGGVR